jgi:hypothetical protein
MRPALDSVGHWVPGTKPTCLLHTWRPHRRRPFALVLHLHQHQSSRNLHLQYLGKNQSTQRCQSLITTGSDHPSVLEHTWSSESIYSSKSNKVHWLRITRCNFAKLLLTNVSHLGTTRYKHNSISTKVVQMMHFQVLIQ